MFHDGSHDVCIFRDVSPEGRLMPEVGRRMVDRSIKLLRLFRKAKNRTFPIDDELVKETLP